MEPPLHKLSRVFAGLLFFCLAAPAICQEPALSPAGAGAASAPLVFQLKPGPWGTIEAYPVFLQAPETALSLLPPPSQQTVWRFVSMSREEVTQIFHRIVTDPAQLQEVTVNSVWYLSPDEVRVHPTDRFVGSLSPQAREELMFTLGRFEENPHHHSPCVIEGPDVRAWFQGVNLSEDVLAAIESTAFPFRNGRVLTDVSYVLSKVTSETEEAAFLRALSRNRALFLRLRVNPQVPASELLDYWSHRTKLKETLPVIESIQRTPGVERLDLVHLIPPVPRKVLFTFPTTAEGFGGTYPNSLWTALNFFELSARNRYNSSDECAAILESRFSKVEPPYRFGDVIALVSPTTGRLLHACVYVADNVVFTKNDSSILKPWVLQTDMDMMTHLTNIREYRVAGWRLLDKPAN